MIDSVVHHDLCEVEWTYTFEASDINAKLTWIGSALVMSINSTYRAEIVLGCFCVELIKG